VSHQHRAPTFPQVASLSTTIARSMRAERARRGWSQEELAERLGWTRSAVASVETERRMLALDDVPAICHAFGVGLADLLTGLDDDLRRDLDV
jgi:transcriptional regulator with XRE-family HTH domain